MPPPRLLVNIDVPDLERGVAFYTRGLGLAVARRIGPGVVELDGAGVPVFLLHAAAGSAATGGAHPRTFDRHWTPVHLDLLVDDVAAAVARAVAAGATLERGPDVHAWGTIATLADPFGHGFCLLRMSARGYDALDDPAAA